jgi:hypothetical protein
MPSQKVKIADGTRHTQTGIRMAVAIRYADGIRPQMASARRLASA